MSLSIPVRAAALVLAAAAALASAACSDSAGNPPPTEPSRTASAAAAPPSGATDRDPCALVTAADVKTVLGQTVSDTERYETTTDDTGTTARCALLTDGKPMTTAVFDSVSGLASGFTGKDLTNPSGASVGVILVTGTAPYDASAGDTSKLPAGSKALPGVGKFAVVLAVPGGGGVGYAQTSATEMVVVYDLEDRTVPTAQMESLLRTAVSRM